jgi:hypothetical protein
MTASNGTTKASGQSTTIPGPRGSSDVERLQARIDELEQQAKDKRAGAKAPRSGEMQKVVIAALGGTVLVTTPLAFLTVKRWWRWWTN